ncbi:MAG: DUF4178 domain-containing protein [Sphingomonadaceae bacterium]|nr:DUF4178 domain-containing protein [Sphingomonadaceae bacterium]
MPPEPPDNDKPSPWGRGDDSVQSPREAVEDIVESVAGARAEKTVIAVDGDDAPAAEQFNCPNCGGSIEVKAAGYTVSIACQYCGSTLDVTQPDVRIIQRYEEEVRKLEIPLGTRGELGGIEWEVIGYLRRSENGAYPWDEYLLFNPYHGYRYLDTDGRGWTLGKQLTASPEKQKMIGFSVDGEFYEPFYAQTPAQVDYVLGEFSWRAEVGEQVMTADYVRPGKMLSWERNDRETVWSLGELLDAKDVEEAFGAPERRAGGLPMPHEPSPHRRNAGTMMKIAAVASVFLLFVSCMFGGTSDPQTTTINLATDGTEQSAKIGPIVLDRATQGVTVEARSPGIDNAWVDLSFTLTNDETGDVYEANNVVESYSGRDAEGNWSEGSRATQSKFSMIPRGRYQLDVYASGSQWLEGQYAASSNALVEVTVAKGATFFSNIVLALLLVFIPALWTWFKHLGFESRRKSDSDFAGDDDDD